MKHAQNRPPRAPVYKKIARPPRVATGTFARPLYLPVAIRLSRYPSGSKTPPIRPAPPPSPYTLLSP